MLIKKIFESYLIDKIKDIFINTIDSKGKTIKDQFAYCIDKSLTYLGEKYNFEYDLKFPKNLLDNLLEYNDIFSRDILEDIISESIDLTVDNQFYQEWLKIINKVIAEEKLSILNEFVSLSLPKDTEERVVYPRLLTAKPALPPEQYVNREEEKVIIQKLEINRKMVLVNGIGGIGKSTVCRTIFHRLDIENKRSLAWIVYNGKNLLEDIKNQMYYPTNGEQWKKEFIRFIEQDIDENAIIFIDNLDVTEDEDEFLTQLSNARCNVICTSRIEQFPHFEIVPIKYFDDEKCIDIFCKYYGQDVCDRGCVKSIITKAGRHTLVIEILAKIGKAENYSVYDLNSKLEQQGFDLEGIVSVENKEDTLVGHLFRTFNFEVLTEVQKKILSCMAIMPNQWVPYKLKDWIGLENNYNINYLVSHAWIVTSELGYYMHPVIKEVVKRGIVISQETIMELLAGISKELEYRENPNPELSREMISFAKAILKAVKIENEIVSRLTYNISMLYAQMGENNFAEHYIKQCIQIEEKQNNSKELLASAYNHSGYIYYYKFMDLEAEKNYKKAYNLRKELGKIQTIAETASNLALLYQGMWSCNKDKAGSYKYLKLAERYQIEAIKKFEHIFQGKARPKLASAYNNMAVIYYSLYRYESAIYYYRKAERIRLELRNKVAAGDLSVTYKGLCDCYMEMATKKNKERERRICNKIALICIEKCIEIRKKEIKNGNMKLNINQLYQIKKRILKLLE